MTPVTLAEYRLALKVAENAEKNGLPGVAKVRRVIEEKIEEAEKNEAQIMAGNLNRV